MSGNIASRWKQLNGEDYWKNLLDPLDIDLRRNILHYGDLSEAAHVAFIADKASKNLGRCRFARADFFSKAGLASGNPYQYIVTRFFYGTSEIVIPIGDGIVVGPEDTNWIGYVAVASDDAAVALGRRDIVIAWRGTERTLEWADDIDCPLASADKRFGNADCKVHLGFLTLYTSSNKDSNLITTSAQEQIRAEVTRLVKKFKDEEISITVTGHSLGASLAVLTAADIAANGYNKSSLVTAFVFGCPRVGDSSFKNFLSNINDLRVLRIRNTPDIIPDLPPTKLGYVDVGEELTIDVRKSNYLKSSTSKWFYHNLEIYLHGVAGTQGSTSEDFKLEVKRDISLVNKEYDALKDKYSVPSTWWTQKNKGMVQYDDGSWHLMDYQQDNGLDDAGSPF